MIRICTFQQKFAYCFDSFSAHSFSLFSVWQGGGQRLFEWPLRQSALLTKWRGKTIWLLDFSELLCTCLICLYCLALEYARLVTVGLYIFKRHSRRGSWNICWTHKKRYLYIYDSQNYVLRMISNIDIYAILQSWPYFCWTSQWLFYLLDKFIWIVDQLSWEQTGFHTARWIESE